MMYGYARVSSTDQHLDTQLEALKQYGVDEIISEKISGVSKKKEQLDELLNKLESEDVLVVTRMDRLGRNTLQLLELVEQLERKKVHLVIMDMSIDTRTATGKFFLTIMAGFSELDRTMIKEKQRAGIELAKQKGKYKGRPKRYTENNPNINQAMEWYEQGDKTVKEISNLLGIGEATIYREVKRRGITRSV
ncbi:recombinase family protein [Bacillus sp. WLY-B-L8]|uniref:recombinase family protein n=1 Tax=Bacillus multifaciens TaxID=3068506 RepID=UPI002740B0C5|nr:recombinase family protein [Bacillus sp. WLY-B-L8]MDP7980471.1 recombinase family protein [Bacillus sp. WLY-B-L8]